MESFRRRLGAGYGEPIALGPSKDGSWQDEGECSASVPATTEANTEKQESFSPPMPSGISSKCWTFEHLHKQGRRFKPVKRISALIPEEVLLHRLAEYERDGEPLIIENWHKHPKWPKELFDVDRLVRTYGHHSEQHHLLVAVF